MSKRKDRPKRLFRAHRGESPESVRFRKEMEAPPWRGLRARMVGPALLLEPVGDEEPHYRECIDYLLRRHADEIRDGVARGGQYTFEIRHDDWCPALKGGGCCTCACEVNLVELVAPKEAP